MKTYGYKVILEPDEDGGYVVVCPSFQGCYSQGETIEEALENIKEAILLCIEEAEAEGEKIPDPSKSLVATVTVAV
ncbi:MAG: type II toxin-antitoxin system HicB family antitoxin [Thermoplasmata archaeon]|nr:MAG: type II toxin-antitoxin system HicB family antitoxin [Thermoplasmata archaeon]